MARVKNKNLILDTNEKIIMDGKEITGIADGTSVTASTTTLTTEAAVKGYVDGNALSDPTDNLTVNERLVIPTDEPTTLVDGAIWITS